MKNLILAAFAALTLTAGIVPMAHAAAMGSMDQTAPAGATSGQFVGGGEGG